MTRRLTFGILTVAMITCLTLIFSTNQTVHAGKKHTHEHTEKDRHHEPDLLHDSMETMGSAFKSIRRQARDNSFDDSTLKQIQRMQTATLIAMHESCDDFANDKQRVIEYRTLMANALKKMLDMELAVLKGNNDDVAQMVRELHAMMKDGHSKFEVDDD